MNDEWGAPRTALTNQVDLTLGGKKRQKAVWRVGFSYKKKWEGKMCEF